MCFSCVASATHFLFWERKIWRKSQEKRVECDHKEILRFLLIVSDTEWLNHNEVLCQKVYMYRDKLYKNEGLTNEELKELAETFPPKKYLNGTYPYGLWELEEESVLVSEQP